jgi:hypothetical protein
MDMVQCLCTHLTSFAGDFFVMPNAIDWSKISLDNLFSNPTVFAVVMTIFGLYIIGMIWARKKDKEDLMTVCQIKLQCFITNILENASFLCHFITKISIY